MAILLLIPVVPAAAGQWVWTPGGLPPSLILSLGEGSVHRTLDLPPGASTLSLVLRKFMVDDERLVMVWKSDGELWMRQAKKIPGDEATELVTLPPGRQITLEIATAGGTPVALIKLRRK